MLREPTLHVFQSYHTLKYDKKHVPFPTITLCDSLPIIEVSFLEDG